jgi:hypothetical protein
MNFHQSNEGDTIGVGAPAQTCLRIHALSPARVSRSPSCARRLYTFAAVRGFQTGPRRDHLSREGNYPPRWIPGRKLGDACQTPPPVDTSCVARLDCQCNCLWIHPASVRAAGAVTTRRTD